MSTLQEREVQRYYQPWLAAHGSSLNVAKHVESIAQLDLNRQGYQPRASRDKAVTAFAQLVALQLNVKRCIISLIDQANQYILAEATRTGNEEQDDGLWLGSTILSRPDAICEHCFVNTCCAPEEDGRPYCVKGLIVNDCRLDDRFKDRPYVKEDPGVRFYAGVPLYSRNGYTIGACAVSDDIPRDGLLAGELRLLQETAQSVMEHLEWARDRVDRFKGERIVRGMATFIEDCSSHREESGTHARPRSNSRPQGRLDGMSRMYSRAADILRESTLADGAAIFGAAANATGHSASAKGMPAGAGSLRDNLQADMQAQPSPSSDSERHDTNTSDSDGAPTSRACKVLAFSLTDEHARAGIESGTSLTVGTLEKYFSLFPGGRAFSFTEDGAGISSEDDSASDREPNKQTSSEAPNDGRSVLSRARNRRRRMDHKELLKKIPGAKSVVFLPLFDHAEEKLIAGVFLWTSVTGRMMSLDPDLSYLRAFGNCIVGEVVRVNMQRNEAAKTTFIASMSHELRSPLHGILGAAEFLMDTATDAYQSGLVTSITTCGKTLLDTLNHVLDYSKINKLGRTQMRRHAKQNKPIKLTSDSALESLTMTAEIDLGTLVEEVAEAVTAGHAFKQPVVSAVSSSDDLTTSKTITGATTSAHAEGHVCVLLDISPRRSWMVRIQPGALRRIIMNLLGNALKYTSKGFVAVSLRAQEDTDTSKVSALIRVVDSGKGMSDNFQKDRLFVPFSQEDPFQPGTGLGLSIVKQIVDSLGGSVDVRSETNVGTEIDVQLNLMPATTAAATQGPDHEMAAIEQQTRGLHLVLVGKPRMPTQAVGRLEQTLREVCTSWFGMKVTKSSKMDRDDADIYLFSEPPTLEELSIHPNDDDTVPHRLETPAVIVYTNAEEVMSISRNQQKVFKEAGRVVEVIHQPCGPRKLAKAFSHCLKRAEEARSARLASEDASASGSASASIASENPASPITSEDNITKPDEVAIPEITVQRPSSTENLGQTMSAAVSYPAPPPIDPETPSLEPKPLDKSNIARSVSPSNALHILLVDDNKINRQLLVMFMKKCQFSYSEAENGQEALDSYRDSCLPGFHTEFPGRRFDYVLMDISMPVMDGMEATRKIREFERENSLSKTTVIALTGLASAQAQADAEAVGIDVFLPKPVRFADLKKLLTAG